MFQVETTSWARLRSSQFNLRVFPTIFFHFHSPGAPILAACLLAQSGSLPFLLFRFCLANMLEGHFQKMCCECLEWCSYPGQRRFLLHCVFRVWAWAKCYCGRLTRAFRCECSSGGVPCVWNAALPVAQSGQCLSSPKPPRTFGFSKFL